MFSAARHSPLVFGNGSGLFRGRGKTGAYCNVCAFSESKMRAWNCTSLSYLRIPEEHHSVSDPKKRTNHSYLRDSAQLGLELYEPLLFEDPRGAPKRTGSQKRTSLSYLTVRHRDFVRGEEKQGRRATKNSKNNPFPFSAFPGPPSGSSKGVKTRHFL